MNATTTRGPRSARRARGLPAALSLLASAWLAACAPAARNDAAPAASVPPVPAHYRDIPVLPDPWDPPYPPEYRADLGGGATAFLIPDSTLDLVRLFLFAPRPNLPATPAEAIRLRLYSALLKDGGTRRLSPAQLEDSLEFIAASLSASLGDWQGTAAFDALGKDAPALLGLLSEVLLEPRLDTGVFRLTQRRMLEARKHRYATPSGVMSALHERVLHGSHPANWTPTEGEIAGAQPADLPGLAGTGYARRGLVIGVAGRFDREEMFLRLQDFVSAFPETLPSPAPPPFPGPRPPGVYVVDKPFAQATLRLAAPGVQRPHPDYYPLVVASEILGGGGFTSRLTQRVRSDEGLAYSVGSSVESDYHRRGVVQVGLQTKAATGAYAVRLVREEVARMARDGITEAELARAKDGLLKSLPSLFSTPAATARIFAQSEAWGRSPEHFRQYRQAIEAMTRAEVENVFRRYFEPDSLRILAVGPADVLLRPDPAHGGASLADFGPVVMVTEGELDARE